MGELGVNCPENRPETDRPILKFLPVFLNRTLQFRENSKKRASFAPV